MAVSNRVANSGTFTVTTPSDREIVLTRLFDAPRRLLFEAMTRPEHVSQWWGRLTDGHSVRCEIDFRPGGAWRFVGRGPEGDYPAFYGVYREISVPERVVFTELFEPYPDVESIVTSVLTEENGKTRLTVNVLYPSLDVRDMVLQTGMEKGAGTSYDRLEELAASLAGA